MKIKDLFEKRNLTGLKVKTPIMDLDWKPQDPDKDAAWDLYVELLTRNTQRTWSFLHRIHLHCRHYSQPSRATVHRKMAS